jgi:plastocyanin
MAAPPPTSAPPAAQLPAAQDVPPGATKIVLADNRYQPATLTVRPGTTIAWVNNGANLHTISAQDGSFESGAIPPGKAFVYTFSKPGTYAYFCRQHLLNGMSGSIVVQ